METRKPLFSPQKVFEPQVAKKQLKGEYFLLDLQITVLEHPETLDAVEAECRAEARRWFERQIGVDGLRRALQDLADPEDEFRDQLAGDHDAVTKDMGST